MKKFIIIAVVIINCFIGLSYSFPTRGRLVEGDIRLPFGLSKSLASSNELNIWPGGVIPYTIDAASNFTETQKATIKNAMAIITANTGCITFVEKTAAHPNWIVIKSLDGCWSYVS